MKYAPRQKSNAQTTKKTPRKATKKTTRASSKKTNNKVAKRTLSSAHKRALAEGRTMSATVDRYLAAVNAPQRRGRKVSKASLEQRLVSARQELKGGTGVSKVLAAKEVRDLQARIAALNSTAEARG